MASIDRNWDKTFKMTDCELFPLGQGRTKLTITSVSSFLVNIRTGRFATVTKKTEFSVSQFSRLVKHAESNKNLFRTLGQKEVVSGDLERGL